MPGFFMSWTTSRNRVNASVIRAFGIDVYYDGSGTPIQGVFNNEYIAAGGDEISVGSRYPELFVNETDVPGIASGKPFQINSIDYVVVGPPEPDGTGMVRVVLDKS